MWEENQAIINKIKNSDDTESQKFDTMHAAWLKRDLKADKVKNETETKEKCVPKPEPKKTNSKLTSTQAPEGEDAKDAKEAAKPAEGEAKPAEGEAKPAEGEAKPAEGEKAKEEPKSMEEKMEENVKAADEAK